MWFQSLAQGEMAVVYWEGDDPQAALAEFAASEDPFDEWLKERGREVDHFEPAQTLEDDEEVFEANKYRYTLRRRGCRAHQPNSISSAEASRGMDRRSKARAGRGW